MIDSRKSTLVIASLTAAFLVGLLMASEADALHQNLYRTQMTPPTHAPGALSYNSCGWHIGSCLNNVNGPAQDWGYWNGSTADYYVRFRGWLYRSSTPTSTAYLRLSVFQGPSGPNVCDEAIADVVEIQTGRVRYGMHHLHTFMSGSPTKPLYVNGTGIGAWNSVVVASMVEDSSNCPWGGYHTHAWAIPVALSSFAENRGFYACCNYGGASFQNNVEGHWTHVTYFEQGH